MKLSSTAFTDNGKIPREHTCEGANTSPPLAFADVPEGTSSLALIVDDPDAPDPRAPRVTWVHWVLYDLPPDIPGLREAVADFPGGAHVGMNDFQRAGWGGPCPPIGRHRYFFKLHALDTTLGDRGALSKADLERAMEGHVLSRAELVGTYQKGDP